MPERIQRKRTKGWRMPDGAVYVGRPTKWGNPWRVGDHGVTYTNANGGVESFVGLALSAWQARDLYRQALVVDDLLPRIRVTDVVRELRGVDLCCWCRLDQPCHADVLLEVANP